MIRCHAKIPQIKQGVMGGGPFRLVEFLSPVTIIPAFGKEQGTPSFPRYPVLKIFTMDRQQIPVDLVLDGNVAFQQPVDDLLFVHIRLVFSYLFDFIHHFEESHYR
jgi:hypothetical protein